MKGIRTAFRKEKSKSIYRKMTDRIKPTSKGSFLQMGTIREAVYDEEGRLVEWVVQDLCEEKPVKRKRRKRQKKPATRTILRKRSAATDYYAFGNRKMVDDRSSQ